MDRKLHVLTCGLPCSLLRAALLYVMGSLGCSEQDALLAWLSGEPGMLSDWLSQVTGQGSQLPTPLVVSAPFKVLRVSGFSLE